MPAKKKTLETFDEAPKNFFNEEYDFSKEEMEIFVTMIVSAPFRLFEKYLARKQNRKAHAMISTDTDERMKELRAQIKGIGEITRDMKLFWEIANRKTNDLAMKIPDPPEA